MARVKVELDEKAIARYFTTDPVAQAGLRKVADEFREMAREATPAGRTWPGSYRYIAGRLVGPFGPPTRHGYARSAYHVRAFRGGFRVYNRYVLMHLIEFGSVHNPTYAPMRRALMAIAGGRAVVNPSRTTGEHTIR